ncbi:MAG: hypothetical protein AABX73_03135 [Nanoarchaeota archaeon]
MKLLKEIKIFILFIFLMGNITLVSAAFRDDFNSAVGGAGEGIKYLFGDVSGISGAAPGEVLFVKLLVFILLLSIIHTALERIPQIGDRRGVILVISIVVSILAVRFITTESLINFIWLPYGVLGVVLSTLLPFIIGFYFIEGFDSTIIRKLGWTTYLVIFLGLAYMRWDSLKTGAEWYQNLGLMYVAIAVISGLLIIFDRDIRAIMFKRSLMDATDRNARVQAANISADIEDLQHTLARTSDPTARQSVQNQIRSKERALRGLLKP